MPGDGGYWSRQQSEATLAAQQAAEKAAAKKAAGPAPAPALTPEQRQANIARDLALSQTRGARPSSQDSQFYQPAYQPQYQNYSNPLTAFNVSNYGTNPGMSTSMQAAMAPGAAGVDPYYRQLQSYANLLSTQGNRNNINTLMDDMRLYGISAQDLQNASSYTPQPQMNWQTGQTTQSGNTLTPELARTLMQRSMKTGVPTAEFQKYGGYDTVKALYDKSGGDYSGQGNPYPQQPAQQQQAQAQFNPYTNQYQTPFSYQQPQYQQQMQTPFSYQQPMQQQMQTPFSYQQPMQQMQQPAIQPNYGPSQAIVGRSSQMRGTPNVMRRAEGGIASLLDNDE